MLKNIRRKLSCLIKPMAYISGIDLLTFAYNDIGILKYEDFDKSGEKYFTHILQKKIFQRSDRPVFFDVGANVGMTSIMLRESFPNASIWAFEPNEFTYKELSARVSTHKIKCFNLGLGETCKTEVLYVPTADRISCSASTKKEVFNDFYNTSDIEEISFQLRTVDVFCSDNGISLIDLLKIDTEGNELSVLKGAHKMLSEGRVKLIQFEFGECHIFSRTFLLDFYKLLNNYVFYRLDTNRLIPLGDYNVGNEIFRFQNILAIHKDVKFEAL